MNGQGLLMNAPLLRQVSFTVLRRSHHEAEVKQRPPVSDAIGHCVIPHFAYW